jgi:hypothetical protein
MGRDREEWSDGAWVEGGDGKGVLVRRKHRKFGMMGAPWLFSEGDAFLVRAERWACLREQMYRGGWKEGRKEGEKRREEEKEEGWVAAYLDRCSDWLA